VLYQAIYALPRHRALMQIKREISSRSSREGLRLLKAGKAAYLEEGEE
jgi:hypothetical protein